VPKASSCAAGILEVHHRDHPLVEGCKKLAIRLSLLPVTLLDLGSEPLVDRLGTCPHLKLLLINPVLNLDVRHRRQRGLDFGQQIVCIARGVCQSRKRLLRGGATRHPMTFPRVLRET
jgi:hypothetical protein